MTPTTDLQKLLAGWQELDHLQSMLDAEAAEGNSIDALISAHDATHKKKESIKSQMPDLAARVIELEAENKRLRERMNTIRALAAKSQNEGGPNFDLEIIEGFAIAALEGGTS